MRRLELTGRLFGRWEVVEFAGLTRWGSSLWKCKCRCGTVGLVRGSRLTRGESLSCGCPLPVRNLDEFLEVHGVNVTSSGGCWLWTRGTSGRGYGQVTHCGVEMKAHRLSYELVHGSIPEGLDICHHCDNPPCVNPSHLFAGTASDNMKDCSAKGRARPFHASGQDNPNHKLTNAQVDNIRLAASEGKKYAELADEHAVAIITIYRIVARRAWSHLASPETCE
jgi:hypothetical protein